MKKEITFNDATNSFEIHMSIPRKITGEYTYGEGTWKVDGVCVCINKKFEEYTLSHTQYLDYKDDLQATQPILYFDTEKEALSFADKYKLMIEFIH